MEQKSDIQLLSALIAYLGLKNNEGKSDLNYGLSNSEFWKRMPDNLIRQIDNVYRTDLAYIKTSFSKSAEYATHTKLNFLMPNGLTIRNKNTLEIYSIISKKNEEYISNSELPKTT